MTAGTPTRPGPHPLGTAGMGGRRFEHRTAGPGTRPYRAWLYHAAARRYALHTGVTARQRRRLPWRTR